jgi:glucuronosyltransferase
MKIHAVVTLFIVLGNSQGLGAARILALVWQRIDSHFPMFETLLKTLASRGHEVVVVSHFPQKTPVKNYTDISIAGSTSSLKNIFGTDSMEQWDNFMLPIRLIDYSVRKCESVLKNGNIDALLKSEDKFDLIITELIACDCFLGFVHKFKAPYIALITSILHPWSNDRTANPDHPAYIPNFFAQYTG